MIQFGGLQFSSPSPIMLYGAAPLPALYCLSVYDETSSPQFHRVVYVGQTRNAAAQVTLDHPAVIRWIEQGEFLALLNVSVFYMPYVRERERVTLANRLVGEYEPELNRKFSVGHRIAD